MDVTNATRVGGRVAAEANRSGGGQILASTGTASNGVNVDTAIVMVELNDGIRTMAKSQDPDVVALVRDFEAVGRRVGVEAGAVKQVLT